MLTIRRQQPYLLVGRIRSRQLDRPLYTPSQPLINFLGLQLVEDGKTPRAPGCEGPPGPAPTGPRCPGPAFGVGGRAHFIGAGRHSIGICPSAPGLRGSPPGVWSPGRGPGIWGFRSLLGSSRAPMGTFPFVSLPPVPGRLRRHFGSGSSPHCARRCGVSTSGAGPLKTHNPIWAFKH